MGALPTQLSHWKQSGQYHSFYDHNIFYKKEGDGDVILLLHGFPTSSWDWHKVWPSLVQNYCLLAFDFLGFGFSDKPRNIHYSIELQADLTEHFLSANNITGFHILAHDYGDTIAQELLHRSQTQSNYQFEIKTVCLLNGGIYPEAIKPLRIQKLLSGPFGFLISAVTNEWIIRKRFTSIFAADKQPSDKEWNEFWAVINYNNGKNISYKLSDYMNQRIRNQKKWSDSLTNCRPPLKLIIGAEDPISGINIAKVFRKKVSYPNVEVLEEVGHYPQVETAIEVLSLYKKFLSSK